MTKREVTILGPRAVAKMLGELRVKNHASPLPRVELVPFVAEQAHPTGSSVGSVGMAVRDVLSRTNRALRDAGHVCLHGDFADFPDTAYWASSLAQFERSVLPRLPRIAVIVTHGNFMRNEISGVKGGHVPNGGIACLRAGGRRVFFVRHCTTCHNINRQGSSALTVCHNFRALQPATQLVRALASAFPASMFGVYASPTPRAILTGLALQREVDETERLAFCTMFGACAPLPSPAELSGFVRRNDCHWRPDSPFC